MRPEGLFLLPEYSSSFLENRVLSGIGVFFLALLLCLPASASGECSDGTAEGECVAARTQKEADRLLRCRQGILVDDSVSCGCPTGYHIWGDGSCILHPHARLFTHDLAYDDAVRGDVVFKAAKFDEVFSHTAFKAQYKQLNPQIKLGVYRNFSALTDSEISTAIPAFCSQQTVQCTAEDMLLHYREDAGTRCDYFRTCVTGRGWNSSCSPVCTPPATAASRAESRTPNSWKVTWGDANYPNPAWVIYNNETVLARSGEGGVPADILLTDNGDFYPPGSAFDKTAEYYGTPLDQNHPRI